MPFNAILFGAGASKGSDTIGTPPLGDDLFIALQVFDPDGWGALSSELADLFRGDFEAGMQHLSDLNPHAMPRLQSTMATYFFGFVPGTSNLYIALAQRIRQHDWQGVLASINYERLLELALLYVGLRPIRKMRANSISDIEIVLPHGCCHIFCEGVRGQFPGVSMSGIGVHTDGPVIVVSNPDQFGQRISDAFPPVMSYFEPLKRTLSGVSFINMQRERWREIATEADVIGLVGIRVRPSDNHIWDPLVQTSAKLVYCSGSRSVSEFKTWAAQARPHKKNLPINGYFAEAFDTLCDELNLG